ncbi:hypothetical protein [Aneurinibacillus aneurinilyticus]|uniref:Uncharacterized protein n=1 Tax=Aneurinibacillus aneurinilyticus ATCC 12856 TaxID=649747 RepID=U1YCM0_ANEAE|nr:hypothetical protein [Aneurinibacillus aneurinilyticus]ERI09832.1 hypothetical protein HMPREF0083_02095 [Aneurinibacillus aneurinilyticus ATCC 12856]MED0708012.1 hypothetical protein [Aneurinibacillus aneurinilyticus]MED0722175.1 hypothetical protein [Aneurinibacillus aneurinilyticus]MED0734335.1 hypothetical protein [Aneurinibacillus aneurinilyticus]MED0741883.1 hypothetical protein [Aneurinibacillus aneurinilyticus]
MSKIGKASRPSRPYFYAMVILTFVQALLLQYVVELHFAEHGARIPWVSGLSMLLAVLMIYIYKRWAKKEKSAHQRRREQ